MTVELEEKCKFCSVKQNTGEAFEFKCSRCGQKVSLKSGTSVVKATTCLWSASHNFLALSFHFKDLIS